MSDLFDDTQEYFNAQQDEIEQEIYKEQKEYCENCNTSVFDDEFCPDCQQCESCCNCNDPEFGGKLDL